MKIALLLGAGLVLLAACQSYQEQKGFSPNDGTMADSTGAAGETEKIVKRADLRFEVRDVQQGTESLSKLAQSMGGTLAYLQLTSDDRGSRTLPQGSDSLLLLQAIAPKASLTVRVPVERLEEFLYGSARLASFVRYSELAVDDKTLSYLEAQWRNAARQQVLSGGTRTTKRIDSAGLAIMDDMIDNRLEQRSIDRDVRFSTVSLQLDGAPIVRRSVVVNTELDHYELPFGSRLVSALGSGAASLGEFALVCARAWWLFALAVLVWIGWRRWGRRMVQQ